MPGKVDPIIPEAVSQVAMLVMGYDQTITLAAASGNLESDSVHWQKSWEWPGPPD
jgi:aspartate ammonia-lyase